jgi:hypothetical protein
MEKNIIDTGETIKYKLEVKNYNDLISRKNEDNYIPLILILFIFPNEPKDWLQDVLPTEPGDLQNNLYISE